MIASKCFATVILSEVIQYVVNKLRHVLSGWAIAYWN